MAAKEAKKEAYTKKAIYFDPKTDGLDGAAVKHEAGTVVGLSPIQLAHFQRSGAVTLDIPQEAANVSA